MEENRFIYAQTEGEIGSHTAILIDVLRVFMFKKYSGVTSALIVGIAIVASAFLLTRESSFSVAQPVIASPSAALRAEVFEKDSDGDGLLDWEEVLWGTDPFLIDTDGDGILDGEEIRQRLANKTPEEIIQFEDLNFTEQFSREFFASYLDMRRDGDLTSSEATVLIQEALESAVFTLPEPIRSDVLVMVPTTQETVALYIREVATALIAATPNSVEKGELQLLQEFLEQGELENLSKIKILAEGHKNFAEAITKIPIPQQIANDHLSLINASYGMHAILNSFSNIPEDPVQALMTLEHYDEASLVIVEYISELSLLATSFGVSLAEGPESVFFVGESNL